ncbi:unnamed protein product [Pleuronectes platessa]|uniref:Uncharacterized protein n=1 Tax=Pleuronectes platessa TaxID=8262 RepID=A0A9N7ULK7_PLEPL|nr:unnamed protein product [Pleuronectes platessa]
MGLLFGGVCLADCTAVSFVSRGGKQELFFSSRSMILFHPRTFEPGAKVLNGSDLCGPCWPPLASNPPAVPPSSPAHCPGCGTLLGPTLPKQPGGGDKLWHLLLSPNPELPVPKEDQSKQWFCNCSKSEKSEGKCGRPSALHRSIATGSCTALEKCAYIITCGPGILQRALLIAGAQSGGGNQPTQEEPGKTLPRN